MSEWKFKEKNLSTGVKYWEKKKKRKEDKMKTEQKSGQKDLSPEDRGNYTADVVADAMEKRDEQKEKAVREAMGQPQKED